MKLHRIFAKPVDRTIEGVIKADDLASLQLEVEEYVITAEISKSLTAFFSAYNSYHGANGAWISGFFGSGKSHLLKMLALLLENRMINGRPVLEYFLPKCGEDAVLKADMRRAASIPSRSILFNIDQKADTISKSQTDALLSVFVKVFNEMCGYYGKQGYIAQFERDLDSKGLLEDFKQAYRQAAGRTWEDGREQIALEKKNIDQAYARAAGSALGAPSGIIDHYRVDYKLSIEDFAELVNDYIQSQGPDFRLNFFVDEVGQYVADNVRLMTNLQTIAESLATRCGGRSWIIVTAQEDMQDVLGEMNQQQSNDFSKIQARFNIRLKLTSTNVGEVIRQRLLSKNQPGAAALEDLYWKNKNNFGTLFEFSDGSVNYRGFRDEAYFVSSYPFIPYQFTLFQSAIENLSKHNAFEGRHSSVGERSMLGVFQQVVLAIGDGEVGNLATFDRMFEGIRTVLKAQIQRSILNAEQHLDDEFAVRLLKALFLVKYVKEFKATPHNLRVLMQSELDQNPLELRKRIQHSLDLLEQQTYIQRNGELYEFLTDEEKDIEQEIKNTEVDSGDAAKVLEDLLFSEIVRDRKIHYDETGQDFPFAKKLDDQLIGREQELALHFVTPLNEKVDNIQVLQANSLGKAELLVVLPADERLVRDLYLYKKTEKYIRQNASTAQQETVRRILSDKGLQNSDRYSQIKTRLRELVGKARLFAAGDALELNGEEPRGRIQRGFGELIVRTYPNLRMLNGIAYEESLVGRCLKEMKGTLLGVDEAMNEAEIEMLAYVQGNSRSGLRTTLKTLVEHFSQKPYGWSLAAIQCILAKLSGRGKIEARADANLLEDQDLEQALKHTHGFGNVILEPQIEFTPGQVRALKDFIGDFFDRPAPSTEARALGKEAGKAFRELAEEVDRLRSPSNRYPFLSALEDLQQALHPVLGKPYTFYFTELRDHEERLFDLKERVLDPIRRFMGGENKTIYDQAQTFLRRQEPNFSALSGDEPARLKAILEDKECYRGGRMKEAKTLVESMQAEIQRRVEQERQIARESAEKIQRGLLGMEEWPRLNAGQQATINRTFERFENEIERQTLIAVIRDTLRRFEENEYPRLLSMISTWANEDTGGEGIDIVDPPPVIYISLQRLSVPFAQPYLGDEADVDQYLAKLKAAIMDEIAQGKRIQL